MPGFISKTVAITLLIISSLTLSEENTALEKSVQTEEKSKAIIQESTDKPTAEVSEKRFKVVAYYPSWRPQETEKYDPAIITHINYAFAIPTENSTIRPLENPGLAKKIIEKAHENNGKVLISVGGWCYQDKRLSEVFANATKTTAKAQRLAKNIASLCEKYDFDGVDIDWEYPLISDGTYKNYETFMKAMSFEMKRKKKLLTIAVPAGITPNCKYVPEHAKANTDKVLDLVDWINVMAYDGGDGSAHSTLSFSINSAKYWRNIRNVPKEKVVLGVPFYSRAEGHGYTYGYSYETITNYNQSNYIKDTANYKGLKLYYNGYKTIQRKTNYALENLGGIMLWEITGDSEKKSISLLCAIDKAIKAYTCE